MDLVRIIKIILVSSFGTRLSSSGVEEIVEYIYPSAQLVHILLTPKRMKGKLDLNRCGTRHINMDKNDTKHFPHHTNSSDGSTI